MKREEFGSIGIELTAALGVRATTAQFFHLMNAL
jgi:hypothetical protein